MEELLQKLLETDVLSEDTKKELEEALKKQVDEAVKTAKEEAVADVRTELTEKWVQERDTLIDAIDNKVDEFLVSEMEELKEDIDRFRDLEAEYAEKLVEQKAQMQNELQGDLAELVEKLDAFLEIRLAAEMEELKEDIEEAKKKEFGRKIFEAFVTEYSSNYADDDSVEGTLRETEERLSDTEKQLEEAERKLAGLTREKKMAKVLSSLEGRQRDVMEAILANVATEQLEEGYKTFIGRVIREAEEIEENEETSEKEDEVLAEDVSEKKEGKLSEEKGEVVTGDKPEVLEEDEKANKDESAKLSEDARLRLRALAGI